jgi:hypothetical protein
VSVERSNIKSRTDPPTKYARRPAPENTVASGASS